MRKGAFYNGSAGCVPAKFAGCVPAKFAGCVPAKFDQKSAKLPNEIAPNYRTESRQTTEPPLRHGELFDIMPTK